MIGSGNWIIDNLNYALSTWNGKLAEIWTLISTSPEEFKGGGGWNVIVNVNDGLKAVGYALLVLFFVMGVVKTMGSFAEMHKPEQAVKCLVRFVLAQVAVSHWHGDHDGPIQHRPGGWCPPYELVRPVRPGGGHPARRDGDHHRGRELHGPLWAVTLLGSLFIWGLSLVMILTVYSRFFKLYMAKASQGSPPAASAWRS